MYCLKCFCVQSVKIEKNATLFKLQKKKIYSDAQTEFWTEYFTLNLIYFVLDEEVGYNPGLYICNIGNSSLSESS